MTRRLYVRNAPYLLTWNTARRYPFFTEDVFCNVLIDCIDFCQNLKSYYLIGYKVNPDHVHLIVQPTGKYNISQIVQNIKRVSNEQINQLIYYPHDENPYKHLDWTPKHSQYFLMLRRKSNFCVYFEYPAFKWQKSFHDRLLKEKRQFLNARSYLRKQASKHDLNENAFMYINPNIPDDLNFISRLKR